MEKENELTLAQLTKNISNKLLESMYVLEIMEDIFKGEGKYEILIKQIRGNIKPAFDEIEKCRSYICILD